MQSRVQNRFKLPFFFLFILLHSQSSSASLGSEEPQIEDSPPPRLLRQIRASKWEEAIEIARSLNVQYFEFHQTRGWRYAIEFKDDQILGITIAPDDQRYTSSLPEPERIDEMSLD